jgi:hypothetical protein
LRLAVTLAVIAAAETGREPGKWKQTIILLLHQWCRHRINYEIKE